MSPELEGENRWTAVLVTDLVGFTEMAQTIGNEQVYALLGRVLGMARTAIEAQGGVVVDTAGDGILAAFGAPNALENAALHACRAALSFQAGLSEIRADLEQEFQTRIRFRTGIASGTTLVARTDGDAIKVVGLAVNKVSRLRGLAAPDEIMISETIRREAEGFIETDDRGRVHLKGFADPVQVHFLKALIQTGTKFDAARRRGIADLVGRDAELARMVKVLTRDTGPRAVVIQGPAGIGKSRLAYGLTQSMSMNSHTGQCQMDGRFPAYEPILGIFRSVSDAAWDADAPAILDRLLALHPDLAAEHAALRDGTRPLDETERALRLRDLYQATLRRIHQQSSTIYVLEDVQWIDAASRVLLERMIADGLPVVVTARPEWDTQWLGSDRCVIPLSPLSSECIAQIAQATVGRKITPAVAAFVAERAEGNPLIAEEIARALMQDERLTDTQAGADLIGDPGPLLSGTLEQLFSARLDRLATDEREALCYAAALGREFAVEVLEAALGRPAALEDIGRTPGLIEQVARGRWQFVHALIRDSVNSSLLRGQRQTVHLNIARALAEARTDGARPAGAIASHYLGSDQPDQAAPYLVEAAHQALGVYALQEADNLLTRLAPMLAERPDLLDDQTYGRMAVTWLRAMDHMGDFRRALDLSERLLPRLEQGGYSSSLSIARTLRSLALTHAWEYEEAHELALTTLREAEQQRDASGAAWAKVALMRIHDETRNAPLATIERLEAEIAPVAERTQDRHLAMSAQYLLCSAYRSHGRKRKALAQVKEMRAYAKSGEDRRGRGYAQWAQALIYGIEGRPDKTREAISKARDNVIDGSGDQRVSLGIEYFCAMMLDPANDVSDKVEALHAEASRMQDLNIVGTLSFIQATADLQAGRLARGWARLCAMENSLVNNGNINLLHQVYAAKCETLLSLAGLTDPTSERPYEVPNVKRQRPGFADIMTFVRLRLQARKRAQNIISASFSLNAEDINPHAARFKIGLGLLAKARHDLDTARAYLRDGLALAEAEGFDILASRARRALEGH